MKLRRLRIEHFKRFRDPLVINGFTDGLNLFAAPNESGKSTVAEAIRAAFLNGTAPAVWNTCAHGATLQPHPRSKWSSTWARSGTTSPRCSWARSAVT